MATREELWNEIEELALKLAKDTLDSIYPLTKDDVEKANQLVYIATSVEVNEARRKANEK